MQKITFFLFFLLLLMTLPCARSQVVINEIMYHDATNDRAEEFVELYNAGAEAADLTGYRFTEGITFVFPTGLVIDAGEYLVLCADSATFISRHPGVINIVGDFTGRLSNDGERITLRDSLSGIVDSLEYGDSYPWPVSADGDGNSLELVHFCLDNDQAGSWEASLNVGGTPGAPNSMFSKQMPVADAGEDQFVPEGDTVLLDGTGSTDVDGEIVSFDWIQTGGPEVLLDGEATPTARFEAPMVAQNTSLTFTLIVLDDDGLESSASVQIVVVNVTGSRVSGTLSEDATWVAANSPYIVTDDLTVSPGTILTIEPGVIVQLFPGTSITVRGGLVADGTHERKTFFERAPGVDAGWEGLRFNGSRGSVLRYCVFEHGSGAGSFSSSIPERSAFYVTDSETTVEHCTFRHFDDYVLTAETSDLTVCHNSFYETGEAINLTECVANIQYNRIEGIHNGDDAIDINPDWIHGSPTPVVIEGNTILRGSGDGIDLGGCSPLIRGNLIYLCADKGISLGEGSDPRIENNILMMNGMGVAVKDSSNPQIVNNTIVRNSVGLSYYEKESGYGGGRGTVINCIVWENGIQVYSDGLSLPNISYSIVSGELPWPGEGDLNEDPLFINAGRGDWRLAADSPAVDSADNEACPNSDFCGEVRPSGDGSDMGALERSDAIHDMDGDGVSDEVDAFPLDSRYALDEDSDTLPDEWEVFYWESTSAGPDEDSDGDGISNKEEYFNGTDPASGFHCSVVINEIHYHPASDDSSEEFIELHNRSIAPVDISHWSITDEVLFHFPGGTVIAPQGLLVVAKDPQKIEGMYAIQGVYGPYARSLSNATGVVRLVDDQQAMLCEVVYSDSPPWPTAADGRGPSLELRRPELDPHKPASWGSSWAPSGTPGKKNSLLEGNVVINEFMALPMQGDDWIELYNTTDEGINLSGFYLSDDINNLTRYRIPDGTTIGPKGFLLITRTERGFGLRSEGETLILTAPDGESIRSQYCYSEQRPGVSQGRSPDGGGDWCSYMFGSPRSPNPQPILTEGVVINEIHYHPQSDADGEEFVEIYNATDQAIDLSNWAFLDGFTYYFPLGTRLGPHSYLVIGHDPAEVQRQWNLFGVLGPFESGTLSNQGEQVSLYDHLGNLVDAVTYADSGAWPTRPDGDGSSLELINPSFDRSIPACWAASLDAPTPGRTNSVFSDNIPPRIVSLIHSPTMPRSSDDVLLQARILDHDGQVASATVFFKKDQEEQYGSLPLIHEGVDSDTYRAVLPPQPDGTLVEFFIRAEDDQGAVTIRPEGAPQTMSTETGRPITISYLYIVDEPSPDDFLPVYRLLVTDENLAEIEARPLTSDILLSAGFVYDNQPFYDVAIRYRETNRERRGIRIELLASQRLHGDGKINLSKYHALEEHVCAAFYETIGLPVYEIRDAKVLINTSYKGFYIDVERVDEDFVNRHFPSDSNGTLIGGRTEVIQGDDAAAIDEFWEETFRQYDNPLYLELLDARIDIGQWIRCLAAMAVSGDLHTPRTGVMANQLNYLRPSDGRIVLLPFDLDEAWRTPRIGIHGDATTTSQADPRIEKFLLYPCFRRQYYEEITGILDCEFAPETIFPVIEDICARTRQSPSRVEQLKSFVEERTRHLEQIIENYIDGCEAFSPVIETNAGISFFTNQAEVRVTGTVIPGSGGVAVFCVEGEPSNLLANAGFEEGTGAWSIRGLRPYVSASLDEEVSHSGLASLKVTVDGGDPDYYGVVQVVDCLPLTKYRLTYFIRATEMQNGHMFVNVIDADNGEDYLSVYVPERRQIGESPWLHSDCDWTYRSGIITTKEQTHRLAVRLCRVAANLPLAGEAAGNIWYDDIRLEEVGLGRQSLGAATYDPNSGQWSKVLPLNPGENVFEFVAQPISSRSYSAPPVRIRIYGSEDADADGLADIWEEESFGSLVWGPESDPDGDELTNDVEFRLGTSANNGDTDGDSMPDGWEARHNLDPTSSQDALQDADQDGLTNLEEFLAGTDPSDASSPFGILRLMKVGETLEFTWFSVPGQTYRVLSSADMDSWTVISNPIIADSAECSFVDNCRDRRLRFYRIELLR